MTPEQLLQPRYKAITGQKDCDLHYPGSPYDVGDIIYLTRNKEESDEYYSVDEEGHFVEWEQFYKNYPHLFRPMEWWEDRKAEDMPRFLKSKLHGYVNKVVKYRFDDDSPFADTTDGQPGLLVMELMNALPATEEEYNNYINSKQ